MDLPSHLSFGLAVALVFYGRPEIALLVGLGTLVPDLDREYWYVRETKYAEEQYHRARFHNVFLIVIGYLISPFFSLGIFLHMLQDSFTTAKDRGVEWFYPLTRLVKTGMYDANMNRQPLPLPGNRRVYFYQQDPAGYVSAADPDLREPSDRPVPWRRVYGFAQNSHLFDRGFLFASATVILIWLLWPPSLVHPITFYNYLESSEPVWQIGYLSIILLFMAGETQRRDKVPKLPWLKPLQVPIFILGLILLTIWFLYYLPQIITNILNVFIDPIPILIGLIVVPLTGLIVIRYYTRGGRTAIV
jgi:hypothetical protein